MFSMYVTMSFLSSETNITTNNSGIPEHCLYLQRELVFFYFQLFRKNTALLSERLSNVLLYIKQKPHKTSNYLKNFYRFLFYVRSEKGEHEITYMMISVWHLHFPELAKKIVEHLFYSDNKQDLQTGCWRDAKYLCDYIRRNENNCGNSYCYQHPLILLCIKLMNNQLKNDLDTYKNSPISNVAKWIPREHKKFDWLHTELVSHWFSEIQHIKYPSSMNHHKKLYRKNVAFLNKHLDTVQIKQCSQNNSLIIPNNITKLTSVKQRTLLQEDAVQKYYTHLFLYNGEQLKDTSIHDKILVERKKTRTLYNSEIPVCSYIKEAFQLINESKNTENDSNVLFRIQLLNSKWKKMVHYISKSYKDRTEEQNIIPMLDISYTMYSSDEECYHTSIGLAFILCEISGLGKRILCVDNLPTWLNLTDCETLTSMVMKFENNTKNTRFTFCNILSAVDVIVLSIQQSHIEMDDVEKMRIVLLSDFSSRKINPDLCDAETESGLYEQIKDRFVGQLCNFLPENMPTIAFWNLSKDNLVELPCSIYQNKVQFLSGYSTVEINNMSKEKQPYQCVLNTLQNRKFEIADKLIQSIM